MTGHSAEPLAKKDAKGRGILRDLRAYFQRGHDKACGHEKPEAGPQLGWLCTLPTGHEGRHVAHDVDGSLITTWPVIPTGSHTGGDGS